MTADELLRVPVACAYAGVLSRLAVVYAAYLRHVHASPLLAPPERAADPSSSTQTTTTPTLMAVFQFAWPLALVNTAQKASRPLVNLMISRSATGAAGVAVMTVCYPIAGLVYGWINELKLVFPAFAPIPRCQDPLHDHNLRQIRLLTKWMVGTSLFVSVIVAWTPSVTSLVFHALGAGQELQSRGTWSLRVLCLLALPVTVRSYCSGFCQTNKRTDLLASSSAARISGVAVACLFLPLFFDDGAVLGAVSLLVGFSAEAAATARGACKLHNTLLKDLQ